MKKLLKVIKILIDKDIKFNVEKLSNDHYDIYISKKYNITVMYKNIYLAREIDSDNELEKINIDLLRIIL